MDHRQVAAELERLHALGPITLHLTAHQAWAVLCNLQLAFRQPANRGPARWIAEQVARELEEVVAPRGSVLAELAARGWHAETANAASPSGTPAPG